MNITYDEKVEKGSIIKISKASDDIIIVLVDTTARPFKDHFAGSVLKPGKHETTSTIGQYRTDWCSNSFKDFYGKLVLEEK